MMSGRRDQHEADSHGRTEPTLGDLDHLDTPRPPSPDGLPQVTVEQRRRSGSPPVTPPRREDRQRRHGWLVPLLLLVVVAVVATAWLNQGRLRGLLPRTDLNGVLSRAQQALQTGHLDGHDGTSARELFQAAVALEPDNDRARDGLHQVGQAELDKAETALQAGQIEEAAQHAAVARELLGGGSDIDRFDQAIDTARARQVQKADLVEQAQQAFAAGKLAGEHGAGVLYQQVLRADPGNAVAAHGLNQVGDALAAQAQKALAAGDTAAADAAIEQLAGLQPNNGALPALRATQLRRRQQDQEALDAALKQGMAALRAGRISGADDSALAHFKAALALDPDNAEAKAGLGKVAQALTVQANAALDGDNPAQATRLLDQAAALAPKSADLAAVRARLKGATSPTDSAKAAAPEPASSTASAALAAPSPQQAAQVAQLVQRAKAAVKQGDIMLPPGNCAYDLYRSALAIDGNDSDALHGLQALPGQAEQQFDQALGAGQLSVAAQRLSDLSELAPGGAEQDVLRQRLAGAWLDQAEQQLSHGDRAGATQSLQQARKLAPNHPRVLDMTARLQGHS